MSLQDDLQRAIGSAYTLERELGGGGMSRVFVARDESLRRRVVVKVLPPELIAGANLARFNREIELAAGLQHPHIVPIHAAGAVDGVPYYTMPYVEGESLRTRLARHPRLTIRECVGILRDVAKALAYAHGRGVVHRDIKPDNVLLSSGSAVVTDFGIAKALAAAKGSGGQFEGDAAEDVRSDTLTALGVSIGTPAYMAPEQAAGDPATDYRADIYAFGCTAYELFTGQAPFHDMTPHRLLAAHIADVPQPVTEIRPDLPRGLASLVMRCLEKDPTQRPQSAAELIEQLDDAAIPSGEGCAATAGGAGRIPLWKALAMYVAAFAGVVILARAAIVAIGLPDWVLPGAVVVMALGLPVVLLTAYVHSPVRASGTMSAMATSARPHVTWSRTALGGMSAVGAFVLIVALYMAMRALGIGPAGSLLAAGVVRDHDEVLVADFNVPGDSALGRAISEAVRTDISQSNVVKLAPASTVGRTLALMKKPPATPIDTSVARVIAQRSGIKAVIGGSVAAIGGRYILTAQLIAAPTGDVLAAFRETAADQRDLLPAVDRLTRALRAKIGESMRRLQAAPALTAVTTSSIEALKKYAQGLHLGDDLGDISGGTVLLEEAVRIDTAFAMAWRKLGTWKSNMAQPDAIAYEKKAFDNREHLTDVERYAIEGLYYHEISDAYDPEKAIASYERARDADSTQFSSAVNLGLLLLDRGRTRSADSVFAGAAKAGDPYGLYEYPLALASEGRFREADSVTAIAVERAPSFPYRWPFEFFKNVARGRYDSAEVAARRANPLVRSGMLGSLHMVTGQFRRARSDLVAGADTAAARGDSAQALALIAQSSWIDSWYEENPGAAVAQLDAAARRYPIERQALVRRPYYQLAAAYAVAGRADRAAALVRDGDRELSPGIQRGNEEAQAVAKALIAMAQHRPRDAVALLRVIPSVRCGAMSTRGAGARGHLLCTEAFLAAAYDLAGDADSARAAFERYVTSPGIMRAATDATHLGRSLQRLGELYEQHGDRRKAAQYYAQMLALYAHADPVLQPTIADVRKRLARLKDPS